MEATPTLGQAEHQHLSDPGKEARARSGIPVVPVFDGYRAFAILGVVMLHLITISGYVAVGPTGHGTLGHLTWSTFGRAVEVLFVVSGFVIFLPTVARGGSFGSVASYAIRRAARLLPAYWMILLISLVLLATLDIGVSFPSWSNIFFHFLGLQGPVSLSNLDNPMGFGVNLPLWTLSVELTFYVILPLIAARYFRHPFIGLLVALVLSVIWDYSFNHIGDIYSFLDLRRSFEEIFHVVLASKIQFPEWAFSFGLGMTGAWVYVRAKERPDLSKAVKPILAVSLVTTVVLAWANGANFDQTRESLTLSLAFSASLATAMVALALAPSWLQWPFANGTVRRLGDISYGIYLSHMLLMIYLGKLVSMPTGDLSAFLVWIVAVLPAAVLYGYLSARFLEQPVRRWARQFGRRAQPGSK